jgi:cytosolic carboxypeptidase protein 2/3
MIISITQNSVSNTVRGHTVKFNITNLGKSESLYNSGMKPLAFSKAASSSSGTGWRRSGEQVRYYCNNTTSSSCSSSSSSSGTGTGSNSNTAAAATPSKSARSKTAAGGGTALHTLTFTHTFTHSDDTVYFAHSLPYTYSDLQNSLEALQRSGDTADTAVRMRRTTLCRTLAGNEVPLITVTAPIKHVAELRRRPAIVLTGRVHPGESNGSYIMEGVLRFITSPHPTAAALRERFVMKVSLETPARQLYICCVHFSQSAGVCSKVVHCRCTVQRAVIRKD